MLFCTLEFLVFFLVVFTAYWATPYHRLRVWILLAASYYFYANWNKWLALIIFGSTTLDYFLARAIASVQRPSARKLLVVVSIAANLGLLCYFKYVNFFLESLQAALRSCGAETSWPLLSVFLPIGISFYTFEAISYIVDVYRGRLQPERSLPNFLLFILFFPHLVAGPIVRARDFLPQVRRRKQFNWARAHLGVQLFLMGLLKKWVIADRMALFADPVFADPDGYKTGAAWIALFAYALQIYGDFSGYSDMAFGLAHLFGYHLSMNFDKPYSAVNISDFWRRWHISLSSWLRDYLFIPLGGSRGSRWATCRNLLITMVLGGLWHGADWNFVLFGAIHGLLLSGHYLFRKACAVRPRWRAVLETVPGTLMRVGFTFVTFALSLVVFRSPKIEIGLAFFRRLVVPNPIGQNEPLLGIGFALTALVVFLAHLPWAMPLWKRLVATLPRPALGAVYAFGLNFVLMLAPLTDKVFIYFQF